MPEVEVLNPQGSDFDRFLYASVGEDRDGSTVTVVSVLARLGFDPWKEAAALTVLGREAACSKLAEELSGFKDVPSLALDYAAVAERLSLLLPERLSRRPSKLAGAPPSKGLPISIGWIVAILFALFVLVRIYFLANSG